MAVTIDQVYALLSAVSSKLDALLTEEGILMSQTADIQNAASIITAEVAQLNDSYTRLSDLVGQLRTQGVDPAILTQFDQALSTLKPSVDRIAGIAPQPAPAPVATPAGQPAGQQAQQGQPSAQQAQQAAGQPVPSQTAAAGQPGAAQPQQPQQPQAAAEAGGMTQPGQPAGQ